MLRILETFHVTNFIESAWLNHRMMAHPKNRDIRVKTGGLILSFLVKVRMRPTQ